MSEALHVLVVGATGMLGEPAARRLASEGHRVRVLVRDEGGARTKLGTEFDYVQGTVTDETAVDRAVAGTDAVHISVGAHSLGELDAVERAGTARIAAAAAKHGLQRISYISGCLVREDYPGEKLPEHKAKLAAEQAIEASGVPYTFFRPTYFMDNFPRHVRGNTATVMGAQKHPIHPVAAADLAKMVARALVTPEAANQAFYVFGPEEMLMIDGLRTYCELVRPGTKVRSTPLPMMKVINRLFMKGQLTGPLQIMGLMDRFGQRGDPGPANALLGAPATTVREWCQAQEKVAV
jgi:uncharacterized protein YbjT (DUF2867 family)